MKKLQQDTPFCSRLFFHAFFLFQHFKCVGAKVPTIEFPKIASAFLFTAGTRSGKLRLKKATLGPSITLRKLSELLKLLNFEPAEFIRNAFAKNRPPALAIDQNPTAIRFRRCHLEASKTSGKIDHRPSQ